MQRVSFAKALVGSALLSSIAIPAAMAQSPDISSSAAFPTKRSHNCPIRLHEGNLGKAFCHSYVGTDNSDKIVATASPVNGFFPADLRSAYSISQSGSSSTTIAIVDAFGYPRAELDLAKYRKQFGLPPCTTRNGCFKKVDQNGGSSYPQFNAGWADETALDLQMASAMCPGCKILLVQGNSNSYQDLATAENTAASLGANVISNSYGGSEPGTTAYEPAYNHPGIAITVSSGDGSYSAGTQFPAASPHVTAVGGTSLVRDSSARGWSETAWSGAGSGCSGVYPKPTWQTDTGCSNRTVADVSAVADPNTGVAVYAPLTSKRSAWLVFGGTSVAAPLIAGIYGLNAGPFNYGSDPYAHLEALYDVTSGSNGSCSPSYICTAIPGYDGPTGLGTPNGTTAF